MNELILRIALRIYRSKRYHRIKHTLREVLTNEKNPYKKFVDIGIVFLILSSVFLLVFEVQHTLPHWVDVYDVYVVSILFGIEYVLRLWVQDSVTERIVRAYRDAQYLNRPFDARKPIKEALKAKWDYIKKPSSLIDLLAIIPAYRPIRILRIFVLFRFLKLLRYAKSINQFTEVLKNKRFELYTLLLLLLFVVFTAGIAIYVLEENINPNVHTLFDGLYWALVTISTVGFGDISPVTTEGRVISMLIIISGIAMISFATSVIVSAFSEKLDEVKAMRIVERINKSESFLIICGYGQMAKMFFRQGHIDERDYIILEKDPVRVKEAQKDGYHVIQEDASRSEVLKRFNVKHANITVLCLTSSDVENIYITLSAKSLSRDIKVIARASSRSMVKKYEHAGADHILLPHEVVNNMLHIAITQPTMYKALHAVLTGEDIAQIYEIHLAEFPALSGKRADEVDFDRFRLLYMGVHRQGKFVFNPKRDMLFEKGDVVLVIGRRVGIEYFKERYGKEGGVWL